MTIALLVALGLIGGAALFAIPDRHGDLIFERDIFANRVRAAHDAAVVGAQATMLRVAPAGYRFFERAHGRWAPMEQALGTTRWQPGTRVTVQNEPGSKDVVFNGDGSADRSLEVAIARGGSALGVVIRKDGSVNVPN